MNSETMVMALGATGAMVATIFLIVLTVLTICLPFVVWGIYSRSQKIDRKLEDLGLLIEGHAKLIKAVLDVQLLQQRAMVDALRGAEIEKR